MALDVELQDARFQMDETGLQFGKDENGDPIPALEVVQSRVQGTLTIPAGQAVPARAVKVTSNSGKARTLVIATARLP